MREEVEENLLIHLGGIESVEMNRVLDQYLRLIALMKPSKSICFGNAAGWRKRRRGMQNALR